MSFLREIILASRQLNSSPVKSGVQDFVNTQIAITPDSAQILSGSRIIS
jgi:hypothetical protein